MEESEKMMGLKKAYAEIILNTAKEAAARIMVSEKRVQQVNHDLSSTKDEALRLLLRLKQTMDSKLNEAEMKSQHQQRRIEELEAQLQEAEDIVSNLRAELNAAHVKMEEMEKNQMHTRPNMMEKAACEKEIPDNVLADSFEENGYVGVPHVPSGIVRSKKPEVCVNGCTQRVRAYEEIFLNSDVSVAGELDDIKDGKILREDLKGGKMYKKPLIGSNVAHLVGNELVSVVDVNNVDIFSCMGQVSKAFRKKRKFATRRRRSGMSLLESLPPMDLEARSDLPHGMLESHTDEVKGKQSVLPLSTPLNVSETGALSEHVVDAKGDDEVAKAQTNAMEEDKEVSRSSDFACSNLELETKSVPSTNSDAKLQNFDERFTNLRPKDRVLKYTFQRKRKKEALSGDDSILVPQENPVKRKTVKKQNSSTEQPNSSSGVESSRDSRRMAQVARQLISLSEKKWWK